MSGSGYAYSSGYGHTGGVPDPSTFSPGGIPGIQGNVPGMSNMSGMPGGISSGIPSTGSPLGANSFPVGTAVPMSTPSPASYSSAPQPTPGQPTQSHPSTMPGYSHASTGSQSAPGPPGRYGWKYWIPAEGISRQVIQEHICSWLGRDALVRPRPGTGDYEAVDGYAIDAYRDLTEQMIQDLKRMTKDRERERQRDRDREERRERDRERDWEREREKRKRFREQDSPTFDPRGDRPGNTPPVQPGGYAPPNADSFRPAGQPQPYPPGYTSGDQYTQFPNQPIYSQFPQPGPAPGLYAQNQVPPQPGYPPFTAAPNGNMQHIYANQQPYPTGYTAAPPQPTYPPQTQSSTAPAAPNYYYGADGSTYTR